jgi:hypothetical protein
MKLHSLRYIPRSLTMALHIHAVDADSFDLLVLMFHRIARLDVKALQHLYGRRVSQNIYLTYLMLSMLAYIERQVGNLSSSK